MSSGDATSITLPALTDEVRALVRLAGAIAGAGGSALRSAIDDAVRLVRPIWAEEVILQSYLFAGFPRTLNAMREWRRASGRGETALEEPPDDSAEW